MYFCLSPSKVHIREPWSRCIALAKAAGFAAVDFPIDPVVPSDQYRSVLAEHNMRFGTLMVDTRIWRQSDEDAFKASLPSLRKQIRTLVALQSTCAATWVLPYSDELRYAENFDWHVKRLGTVAKLLHEHGCTLSLEFVGPKSFREGHRYSFVHTLEQILDLCEAIGPNANVLLDSWHWHASLGTIGDLHALSADQVGLVHVNDAPAGVPVDQLQDNDRRLPGTTGVIDIGCFMAALRRIDYAGALVAEPFDTSLMELAPEEAAKRTVDSLERIGHVEPHPRLPATMRVIATGNRAVRIVEQPTPTPVGNQVIVRLHATMLCGSNMHQYFGEREKVNGGHEGAGEVIAVAHANRLKVGDRVALAPTNACGNCRYCRRGDTILCRNRPRFDGNFAEFTRVSEAMCIPLPDDISYEHGALLGCGLGPPYGALRTLGVRGFDTLVVTGLGPVGLGVCALAKFLGARVLAVDPEPYRRQVAQSLGVDFAFDSSADGFLASLRASLPEYGLRFGIDCSGNGEAQRMHLDLAAPGARIAFVGENKTTIPLSPSHDCIRKNISIFGIWHMNMNDAEDLIEFLRRRPDQADRLLTHRFPISQAQQAFDVFASRQAVKVVVQPVESRTTVSAG